jgi:hypothetical protein
VGLGCFLDYFFWNRAEEDSSFMSIGRRDMDSSSGLGVGGLSGLLVGEDSWRIVVLGGMDFEEKAWGDWESSALGLD